MRLTILFSSLLLSVSSLFAQETITVSLSGNIFNTKVDTVILSQYFGNHYKDYNRAKLSKKGDFSLKATLPAADYYVLRVGGAHINLILRNNSTIKIYGDGSNIFAYSNIVGSDESVSMNNFVKVLTAWNNKRDSAVASIQKDPSQQESINQMMQNSYYMFQGNVQSFIGQNQNSPALLPVLSTLEPEKDFATYESIVMQLNGSFAESPTIKEVYRQYQQRKAQKDAAELIAPGKVAPDFEEVKTDGTTKMKLSDLRGKVVLLDFWASWCGPCRKENPNVVRLYEKYKNDGFTVMSVSLDKDKNAWLGAIAKDNLSWPNHVSDLQQWQSRVARIYQVTGIPFTALLDREGKIIQTNLRGEALEEELKRIFGK